MTNAKRAARPIGEGRDELDDSWFDLPVIEVPVKAAPRDVDSDLDDSWFDRPGRGIKRSDVIG